MDDLFDDDILQPAPEVDGMVILSVANAYKKQYYLNPKFAKLPETIQEELQGSSEDYYVVQKGDTLDLISKKLYGTTSETDAICRMNGLKDGNLIFIGQKLLLP